MQKRRCYIFPVLFAAVVLLLAGCQSRGQTGALTANGTIEATEVNVTARVGGTLQKLGVREGDRVKAGQLIGQLDTRSYSVQENQAQAGVAAAQASLDEAKSGARSQEIAAARQNMDALAAQVAAAQDQLTLQEDNFKRAQSLFQAGAIPEQSLQEQQTACDTARHKLAGIKAQQEAARAKLELLQAGSTPQALDRLSAGVNQSEDNLKLARLNLDWTRLTAPISGTVISRNFEPGELIRPGAQVITLQDDRDRWLNVYVPENRLDQVKAGQPVQIRVDAYPDKTFPGRVEYISPQAEFTPRNVQTKQDRVDLVFRVKVRVTGGWAQLKPGVPADVTFTPPETAK